MQYIIQAKLIISLQIVFLLFAGALQTQAQAITSSAYQEVLAQYKTPTNCEENISIIGGIDQEAGADGIIIIISRLGEGERQEMHNRRLHNAKTYLIEFGKRNPKTIIVAKGESVKGYGRVELYTGTFFFPLTVPQNKDLLAGVCVFEENENPCAHKKEKKLYPCLGKRVKIKNNNQKKFGKIGKKNF